MKPLSYTNRCGEVHYFKAVPTKKGGMRYYLTKDPKAEHLITDIPEGFEVTEYPYDGRVVMRKIVLPGVTEAEVAIVQQAMEKLSPVQDFIITSEKGNIAIHISQFSHYFEAQYLTAEQAREGYGEHVDKWKRYGWILSFEIVDQQKRSFQVIRKASVQYDAIIIDKGPDLKVLAEKYCPHVGRESLLEFWVLGEEDW